VGENRPLDERDAKRIDARTDVELALDMLEPARESEGYDLETVRFLLRRAIGLLGGEGE
jgi:hypothetical protein